MKYAVIAPDYRTSETERARRMVDRRDWLYCGIPGILRGHRFAEEQVVIVGEWWHRIDLSRVMMELGPCMVREADREEFL